MVKKIKYENKVSIQNDESIENKNKVTDSDMNEIKEIVNNNADELSTVEKDINDIKSKNTEQDTKIATNETNIKKLQTDNTTNKKDISNIKTKDTEQDKYIAEIEAENSRLREDINGLPKRQASGETIDLSDSAEMRCDLKISGNSVQNGEPTPDIPVEVECCGDNGSINEVICNKNLAKINETDWTLTDNNTIKNKAKNGGSVLTEFYLKKGQTINMSLKLMSKPTRDSTFTIYANSHNNVINSFERFHNYKLNKTYTVTYTATENSIIYLKLWGNGNSDIFEFQFWAELDNVTEYLQHKSQTYTIPTQQPFRAIRNTRDTFIKKNNKWYERHYSSRYIFTGKENFGKASEGNLYTLLNLIKYSLKDFNIYCNFFKGISNPSIVNISSAYNNLKDNEVALRQFTDTSSSYYIYFRVEKYTSIDDFKSFLTSQYNAGTPVYIDYILETPLDIECTEEQNTILDKIEKEAKTYKNVTHIYSTNNVSPNVEVTYKKDIETLFANTLVEGV